MHILKEFFVELAHPGANAELFKQKKQVWPGKLMEHIVAAFLLSPFCRGR